MLLGGGMRKIGPACALLCATTCLSSAWAQSQSSDTSQQANPVENATPPGDANQTGDVVGNDRIAGPPGGGLLGGDPSAPGDAPATETELPPLVTTGPLSAWGDSFEQANLVLSRPRPGLDPQGIRLGSFTLLPSLTTTAGYDDNIFATQTHKVDSATVTIEPSLQLSRQTPTDSLSFSAGGLIQRYLGASRANYEEFAFKGDGAFDLSSSIAVQGSAHYDRKAEPYGTAGDISVGGKPTIYYNPGANIELLAGAGPLQFRVGGAFDHFDYVGFRYRDRNSYAANGQVGIEVGPGILAFASGAYDRQEYRQQGAASLPDNHGYSVLAGLDFQITKLVRGRIGAGYLWRNYSSGFAPLHGLNYDASVVWNVSTLVTVTAKAAKTIEESPSVGISGIIANTFSLSGDWELTRKIIISAGIDYAREKYRAIPRVDHRVEPSASARYLLNRNMSLVLSYDYRQQFGHEILDRRYKENIIRLGINLQK
jgi:hypothetical protein